MRFSKKISRRYTYLLLILLLVFSLFNSLPTSANSTNPQPNVIPALREWIGNTGLFTLTPQSRICIDPNYETELLTRMTSFKDEIKLINNDLDLSILTSNNPTDSDIYITLDCQDTNIGTEGYLMDIDNILTIKANTADGAFYGTRSLLQILVADNTKDSIPKGDIRDYPMYEERAFMIDVSRKYFTMDFLRDYVKLMSWFKMNDFHIHWTDDWYDGYWAFRIESTTYPNITATDGSYTKQEVIALQDLGDIYGITITPEFDSPSHARPYTKIRPDLINTAKGDRYLDLHNPDTYTFMQSIYDEYIPLFRAPDFHIGCDEYDGGGEKYRQYYNTMADYVQNLGKNVRVWTGWHHESGTTVPDSDITIDVWEGGFDVNNYVNRGNKLINSSGDYLYIVPDTSWLPDLPVLYEQWEPHIFNRAKTNKLTPNHEKLLGAKLHIWLDGKRNIVSQQDCDKLIQPPLKILSEKLWGGKNSNTYEEFVNRTLEVGNAPGINLTPTEQLPPIDPNNLAYNKPVTASSTEDGTYFTPEKAVDRFSSSRWSSNHNDNEFIYVDLLDTYNINKVKLHWEAAYGKKYKIQVSTDAINWIDVYNEVDSDGNEDIIDFSGIDARYVKMQGVERKTNWGYSLYDFCVYETIDQPANLAVGKPFFVSGVEPATSFNGPLAVDGNKITRWASDYDDNSWCYVDLGEIIDISKVLIHWENAFGKKYKIQISDDATNWIDIYTENDSDGGLDTIPINHQGRYIKMQGIERATKWGYSIWELEVYN